ncbi:MAG: 23S rRNA (pseudouridine(1915)-N(3))-methyltransferase RlmH [Deltaproteobacteria bacterium]|nr:23S rRNA (pseudouridine(1915)-N(3))-methyltransferase RlmH [Deltaproteobacteria bacterium]
MTWELILVSKPNFAETRSLVELYQNRLRHTLKFEEKFFKDEARLRAHLEKKPGVTILLDERGKSIDSKGLAQKIQRWREGGHETVRFCVGNAYGFSEDSRKSADWLWKLSDLTLPGDFAWLLLWEQVFRAFSILNKTGYHHD